MNELIIQIDWPHFLGIMGALIGIAWYSSARFTKIEGILDSIEKRLEKLESFIGNV